MVKSETTPKKFIVKKNLLEDLATYTKPYGDHAYAICDEFILERVSMETGISFDCSGHKGNL